MYFFFADFVELDFVYGGYRVFRRVVGRFFFFRGCLIEFFRLGKICLGLMNIEVGVIFMLY